MSFSKMSKKKEFEVTDTYFRTYFCSLKFTCKEDFRREDHPVVCVTKKLKK